MKASTITMSKRHFSANAKNSVRDASILELTDLYNKLNESEAYREVLVWAMSEVKATVDHWGEETPAVNTVDGKDMIKHDINRLQEIVDWCIEETKKVGRKS